jgi:tetratricopeptide (TPR) repeat protein
MARVFLISVLLGLVTTSAQTQSQNEALASRHFEQAIAYQRAGDNDKAIAEYTEAIRLLPNYTEAYYWRGTAYFGKRDQARALADYNEAIRLYPTYPEAYVGRGNVYARARDYTRALADYLEAITLKPDSILAHQAKGLAHEQAGQRREAIDEYKMAVSLTPDGEDAKHARDEAERGLARLAPQPVPITPAWQNVPSQQPQSGSMPPTAQVIWYKLCLPVPAPDPARPGEKKPVEVCLTQVDIRDRSTAVLIGKIAVRDVRGEDKPTVLVLLPADSARSAGALLKIDGREPLRLAYTNCDQAGCLAEVKIEPAVIGLMKNGKQISYLGLDASGQARSIAMPLSGFSAAYDGPPIPVEKVFRELSPGSWRGIEPSSINGP